ncbi:MAG: DMT family transporter [Chloroflexota bacterium]|nr:DMT family transporter [Chloroflexota bacterium]
MSDARLGSTGTRRLQADLSLLLVAIIWGNAFVAQRVGMEQVGPFAFNATRFGVGSSTLIPILGWKRLRSGLWDELRSGVLLGMLLFAAAALQQVGLIWTTASKAGFITGLYVAIVPLLLALGWGQWTGWGGWLGAGLGTVGLFLLSVEEGFRLAPGDAWVAGSALMWAVHVIAIGQLAPRRDPLRLAFLQYLVCSLLSFLAAVVLEPGDWAGLLLIAPAVLYAGVLSIGLGYTAQVFAQRRTTSAHAAIILSTEAVFAALSGWIVLNEALSPKQLAGCGLMLMGMLLAQLPQAARGQA